jgi:hypothetical protein
MQRPMRASVRLAFWHARRIIRRLAPCEGGVPELYGVLGGRPSLASISATRVRSAAFSATRALIRLSARQSTRLSPANLSPARPSSRNSTMVCCPSDGGILLLREAEQRFHVADRLAACMVDPCALELITHTLAGGVARGKHAKPTKLVGRRQIESHFEHGSKRPPQQTSFTIVRSRGNAIGSGLQVN